MLILELTFSLCKMATGVSHSGVFVDDHLLEAEIQQAEQEFLENSMIEETDDGEDFADPDFEACLEYAAEVTVETQGSDGDEKIADFLTCGCGCKKYHNEQCSESFSCKEISDYQLAIAELDRSELDMVLIAQLHAGMNSEELLTNTRGVNRPEVRRRITFTYMFKGRSICREMFIFLHKVSRTRLYNIAHHLTTNGFMARVHGNKGKKPKHSCTFDEISHAVDFIKCYADVHAVPLPGRLPKHQDYRVMKLPSDVTKASVYSAYQAGVQMLDEQVRIVSYRQFCRLWQEIVPFVTTMKPSTDLCFVCQENVASIMRSSNLPEDEKSDRLKLAEKHLKFAKEERAEYNKKKQASKEIWAGLPSTVHQRQNPPGTVNATMLYSFDHAQLVHIPSNPMQPGPAYFKTARRCEIFGICCEGSRVQTNYLIDEAESIGKGSNAIISYLHHYLEAHGIGEKYLQLQADNCVGQNKNNPLMQYLIWRCMTGRHSSCSIHFMIVGHTRFSPDQYFGLIKRKYRKTRVSSITQLSEVVTQSTFAGINQVQLAFDPVTNFRVPCYDWKNFLARFFNTIPSILKYHHFYTSSDKSGKIELQEFIDSPVTTVDVMKQGIKIDRSQMPQVIPPPGLSFERQVYLFQQIRQFCEPEHADATCPEPSCTTIGRKPPSNTDSSSPQPKRARLCSHCKCPGHTKTARGKVTCPKLLNK